MRDAMRGYLNAATGITELTRKRAQDLAQSLLSATGATSGGAGVAHQVSTLAEELVSAARSNRRAVREMVRGEVEIAVSRLGLVPAAELAAARKQIAELESAVAQLRRGGKPASTAASGSAARGATRTRPPRAALKRSATAAATAAGSTPAPAAPTGATGKATAKKATGKKATTKKATTKKATTKKATAKKATAKKASAETSTAGTTTP
jgi:polyhydroxyalkanoate synthesis regulator phasin